MTTERRSGAGTASRTRDEARGAHDSLKPKARLAALVPALLFRRKLFERMESRQGAVSDLRLRIATSFEDRMAAIRLAHSSYVARGIERERPQGFKCSNHHLSPCTTVFTAHAQDRLVGTLSLLEDCPLGLPMECVHGEEVARRRAMGRRLAEVGTLAVEPEARGAVVSFLLYNIMFRWARHHRGVDDLMIAVHPRGEDAYRKVLLFEKLGPCRRYASLGNAASVPLALDLPNAAERYRRVYARKSMEFSLRGLKTDLFRFFITDPVAEIELPDPTRFPFSLSLPSAWSRVDIDRYLAASGDSAQALPAFILDTAVR